MPMPSIALDHPQDMPIYMRISLGLIQQVRDGRLAPGSSLPSSRSFAQALGVNRKTVVQAYAELTAQGWLTSQGRQKTAVSSYLPDHDLPPAGAAPLAQPANAAAFVFCPAPPEPLAIPTGPWIKLDEGSPDGRLFPVHLLVNAYRQASARGVQLNQFQYRYPRGSPALRQGIADMLRKERGMAVDAANICITRGSQMGIFLAMRILIEPGDAVLFEALSYAPAVSAALSCGGQVVPVGLSSHGIDLDAVERHCRSHRVKAIFLTPDHQFPTTITMPLEQRLRLLDLARRHDFAVIEDDYGHEHRFGATALLPMASYAPDRVIHVGSLSRLLVPDLRLGFVVAPLDVVAALAHHISLIDGMGSLLVENAAAELFESGEVRRHVRKMNRVYHARRDAFEVALADILGGHVDYRLPETGTAFWLRFRDPDLLDRIERNAHRAELRFAPSRSFMVSPDADRGLRIGFASLSPEEAVIALRRMRRAASL